MRAILRIVSLLALVALTLPSIIFLAGRLELDTVKWIMLVATVVWFVAATPWMWKDKDSEQQEAG
jgi:nitrate/nitrite transporter NarK